MADLLIKGEPDWHLKVNTMYTENHDKLGDLTTSTTTDKSSAVAITNEINASLNDRAKLVNTPQQTTADVTYYVDVTNGSDTNNGLASGTAFKTIAKAISLIPQIVNHNITINVASGTYAEIVNLSGFGGKGYIKLVGGSSLSDNYIVQNFIINYNTCHIRVQGFKCSSATADAVSVYANVFLELFYIKSDVVASSYYGITVLNSLVTILGCSISNRSGALNGGQLSTIASRDWVEGSGNTSGITSLFTSTIGKTGIQPQGTTAEVTGNGGVIR